MEAIQEAIVQLTGAVNAQIEQMRNLELRLGRLENPQPQEQQNNGLQRPLNEQDLREINKLPDCVKQLQEFDGNPTQFTSFVHNVDNILNDYNIVRNRPIYRAILQAIRQKIRGGADAALISYNIFNEDWQTIKDCLALHYADRRDVSTLEHQLNQVNQGRFTVEEFYAKVNHTLSLIINKIKTEDHSEETITALIEKYRNRALDVFIRGLNREMSMMLMIKKPITLPEAYTACLEIHNIKFRGLATERKYNPNHTPDYPINKNFPIFENFYPNYPQNQRNNNDYRNFRNENRYERQNNNNFQKMIKPQQQQQIQKIQQPQNFQIPQRPTQPKPPVPMEVDRSIQTRQVNYMNRPTPTKLTRNYQQINNVENDECTSSYQPTNYKDIFETNYNNDDEENKYEKYVNEITEEESEVNFLKEASRAYPI